MLIDVDWSAGAGALRDSDVSAIRDRVNKALSMTQGTLEHQARAITKLCNGGILIELNSDKAIDWFQDSEIRKTFLSHLHPSASIKPCLYNIVVQFIPLSFRPGRESNLREIEEVNGISKAASRRLDGSSWRRVARRDRFAVMSYFPISPHSP